MSKAIRILHVLGGTGLGGAESRIMDLYRQMDREEIQFDFLVHSSAVKRTGDDASGRKPQFYDEEIRNMGGQIYVLPKFKVYNYFIYRDAVKDFFAKHNDYRVVQGHMTSTASIYLPLAKRAGVPITVAHSRSAGAGKGLKSFAIKVLRKNLYRKTDYCFACSKAAGIDAFGEAWVNAGNVKIIHNAIDVGKFVYRPDQRALMRERLNIVDKLVIGHVGRFDYQKNHSYLIDIFAKLCELRQDTVLLLLGEGSGMEAIKEKCCVLGITEKVRFLGNQKHPEDYYQAMDIFLLPSLYEGLPGVLVEAQAAGLKCFVSDTVTREAKATDLVTYLSIEQPAEEWAKIINASESYERCDTSRTMRNAGFDVAEQAAGYCVFYQKGDCSKL